MFINLIYKWIKLSSPHPFPFDNNFIQMSLDFPWNLFGVPLGDPCGRLNAAAAAAVEG